VDTINSIHNSMSITHVFDVSLDNPMQYSCMIATISSC
jgi:hypothetical protein